MERRHFTLKALSLTPGLGSSWYGGDGSLVVRYQPWAKPQERWTAEWKDLFGEQHVRYGETRQHLYRETPFTFALQRAKKETGK